MKKCSKCKKELSIDMFHKNKRSEDGFFCWCKLCKYKYYSTPKWRKYHRELRRSDYWKKYAKKYYKEHPEKYNNIRNKEYHKNYKKTEKYQKSKLFYERRYLKNNLQARLAKALRSRIYDSLKGRLKLGSAITDLGCSIPELKLHLESQFKPGMTWENWGKKGWNIDHKKALANFDLTNKEDFLKATNYTNLQPLWWRENLLKRDKLIDT